jgi:hypothetical protein
VIFACHFVHASDQKVHVMTEFVRGVLVICACHAHCIVHVSCTFHLSPHLVPGDYLTFPLEEIFGRLPRSSNLQREEGGGGGRRVRLECGGGCRPCRSVVDGPHSSCLNDDDDDKSTKGRRERPRRLTPAGGLRLLVRSVACCRRWKEGVTNALPSCLDNNDNDETTKGAAWTAAEVDASRRMALSR